MKKYLIFFFLIFCVLVYFYFDKQNQKSKIITPEDEKYSSNIIKDVNYTSKDGNGNTYIIDASEGEIDLSNSSVIFLKDVKAIIKLDNKDKITITSKFGKYNIDNFDTIFSKDVIVIYLDNKIDSQYMDFSLRRNSMIISKNVVYTNTENMLKADVIELDIKTKDTKIFMHDTKKQINIKNLN